MASDAGNKDLLSALTHQTRDFKLIVSFVVSTKHIDMPLRKGHYIWDCEKINQEKENLVLVVRKCIKPF